MLDTAKNTEYQPNLCSPDLNLENRFYALAQSNLSNQLQKIITATPNEIDAYGNGEIVASKDFRIHIQGYEELVNGINQSAAMLLDCLMIIATDGGLRDTFIELPLKKYMIMRGLKDEKSVRAQVKRDIDAFKRVRCSYYKYNKKKERKYYSGHIADKTFEAAGLIFNGKIYFRFSQNFFDIFKVNEKGKYLYMYLPKEALQGNIKQHPHKYWFARKISEHKRMNLGKPNENIIGVRTLIEACPNLPSYENIANGNRNITKRMIKPFERDMNELNEILSWHYTSKQESPKDYESFISATVTIQWESYPDVEKLKYKKHREVIHTGKSYIHIKKKQAN